MKNIFTIIIPTWNNPQYLNPCVQSIMYTNVLQSGLANLIIVNNGDQPCEHTFSNIPNCKIIKTGTNLGWEGGLKEGLKYSDTEFVVFQNDDTFIPKTNYLVYEKMLIPFQNSNVGLVGPTTTTAAGMQSIYHPNCPHILTEAKWLIFFTVMVRRKYLDEVGGIDDTLPGGDDIDLSIRMRKSGRVVAVTPDSFLIHHGFKTGTRVYGDGYAGVDGGWNSVQMSERTNRALINKHGFKTFFDTISNQQFAPPDLSLYKDHEGDLVKSIANKYDKVLEVGCGYTKTLPNTIGVDLTPKNNIAPIHHGHTEESVADLVADVTEPMPFEDESFDCIVARHILEHCIDPIKTIRNWGRYLKPGGDIIIAVPNQETYNTIPLSPDHVHGYTMDSLKTLLESNGFKQVFAKDSGNGISFVSKFTKDIKIKNGLDRMYEGDISTIPIKTEMIKC